MNKNSDDHEPHEGLLDRPLSPRSLVASLLLGMDPPRMRGADLVAWCDLFGVGEGTTRVALSRMVDRGELAGAGGRYELSGALVERRDSQETAVDPTGHLRVEAWSGDWSLVVVRRGRRSPTERAQLRRALDRLRHGELREGVWLRPANLVEATLPADANAVVVAQCDRWVGRPVEPVACEAVFGLAAWADRAEDLVRELAEITGRLDSESAVPRGFYTGAATLQHLRRDQLLPTELLPDDWPAGALRETYREFQPRFARAAERFVRSRREGPEDAVSLRPVTSAEVLT